MLSISLLLAVAFAPSARAQWSDYYSITKGSFFDFERARGFWQSLKTKAQLDSYIAKNCPKGGPYDDWRPKFSRDQVGALKALEQDADAEQIKRCHDLQLVIYRWRGAVQWAHVGTADWNKWPDDSYACQTFKQGNIFTNRCTDVPFWFSPK